MDGLSLMIISNEMLQGLDGGVDALPLVSESSDTTINFEEFVQWQREQLSTKGEASKQYHLF